MSLNWPLMENNITREDLDTLVEFLQGNPILTQSENVSEFEREWSEWVGVKYSIFVNSGSSANLISLAALKQVSGSGGEIIVPPLTWVSDISSVLFCGYNPVFVDINPKTLSMNDEQVIAKLTKNTKAVIPVHFTGLMCEMDRICEIAKKHDIHIIEDAAQSFGAEYRSQKAGSFSSVAIFSMNSMKVLGGFGETGAAVTDREDLYEKLKMLRYTGTKSDPSKIITNEAIYVSLNHKIDTIQAAMLLVMMKYLPDRMKRRTEIAMRYNQALSDMVLCPEIKEGNIHGKKIGHITMLKEESIKINSDFELWIAKEILSRKEKNERS